MVEQSLDHEKAGVGAKSSLCNLIKALSMEPWNPKVSGRTARYFRRDRERKGKGRATIILALYADLASMRLHDMFHDGQPQTGPSRLPGAGLIHAIEAFKKTRQVLIHNTDPGVLHLYDKLIGFLPGEDMNLTA